MPIERTFSIIKPDAVGKNLIGQITQRFEENNLKIVASKIQLRRMPKIIFIEDKTFDYADKLSKAIKDSN